MSQEQHARQNLKIKLGNKSFERVERLKYLGTTLPIKILCMKKLSEDCSQGILAIIRCRILYFNLLFKNTKIKICGTIVLPVVLDRCKPWSFILNEKYRLFWRKSY
jgi:hypothetical protein